MYLGFWSLLRPNLLGLRLQSFGLCMIVWPATSCCLYVPQSSSWALRPKSHSPAVQAYKEKKPTQFCHAAIDWEGNVAQLVIYIRQTPVHIPRTEACVSSMNGKASGKRWRICIHVKELAEWNLVRSLGTKVDGSVSEVICSSWPWLLDY